MPIPVSLPALRPAPSISESNLGAAIPLLPAVQSARSPALHCRILRYIHMP